MRLFMRTLDKQAMGLVVLTLVADQLSKELLLRYLLQVGTFVQVIDDFFRLVIVWNPGGLSIEEVSAPVTNSDGLTETETVRVLPSVDSQGSGHCFVRLRVTAP